ncbi:MAG: AAA family ATPase [Acidobacteriota bacterium]|nr:AAA family ATPase [Acidobacteriota bacterium]
MFLVSATVRSFKSIREPQTVKIDEQVTVFVGMNEAGKTVFLQALEKSRDVQALAKFDPVDDYPRSQLPPYLKRHDKDPEKVVTLTYALTDAEVKEINQSFAVKLSAGFQFSVTHKYDNKAEIGLKIGEQAAINQMASAAGLSSDAQGAIKKVAKIRAIPETLKAIELTDQDKAFVATVEARIAKVKGSWDSVIEWEVWQWLSARIPSFWYFGDYDLLPSKVNLAELAQRVEQGKADPKHLESQHRGVLALLRMADIQVADFAKPGGYERLKAKIEAVSISLTDQIMEFWKQNEQLEVEVAIAHDPDDYAPFNNGPNLYLRIKNQRQRGVSTPFGQRSKGFIWFFSFLVWFDDVKNQLASKESLGERDLILLLDEPGLSLHALAQEDFLRYIDSLATRHQVLYTTHSPFMIHNEPERLQQVRTVEDRATVGTVISESLEGSDPRTLFPLQAALGWTIAQNLFISKRNLLVEGPSELMYLQAASAALEAAGRVGLRDDITIVPVGGLDKVATFIALLGANGLDLAVFHDYRGAPEQRIQDLVQTKIIKPKSVLNPSQFRDLGNIGKSGKATDIEDLFEPAEYVGSFNLTFAKALGSTPVAEASLPAGDRIVDRLERFLSDKGIKTRPSGGFNHYLVASHFVSSPAKFDAATLNRFEALFKAVNDLF